MVALRAIVAAGQQRGRHRSASLRLRRCAVLAVLCCGRAVPISFEDRVGATLELAARAREVRGAISFEDRIEKSCTPVNLESRECVWVGRL